MELRTQRELLDAKTEMAQEEAKLKVLDEFEAYGGIEPRILPPQVLSASKAKGYEGRSSEFRTTLTKEEEPLNTLNPEAAKFVPKQQDKDGKKSPTPEEFLQGLVTQQATVANLMIDHNKQASLPTRVITPFDGDPLHYTKFTKAFKHAIEEKTSDPEDRLCYLEQYTRGEAKRIVASCTLMDPEEGYRKAKESLKERYGTPYKISQAYSAQVSSWPDIKPEDKQALKDFVLFLIECQNAMDGEQHLQELNHYSNIKLLVGKLPFKLRERWRKRSHDIFQRRPVDFADFVTFAKMEEDVISNEVFGDLNAKERGQNYSFKPHQGKKRGASLAVTTSPEGISCKFCEKSNHSMTECRALANKSYDERLQYFKGQGLCFGCLKDKTHLARDCKQRANCGKCQKSHPTVLHRDVEAQPKKTAAVGRVVHPEWEGVPSIIPVKVRSKTSGITVKTYAFLDTGSDVVFCTDKLKQQLNTKGRKTRLTLNTINSSKETLTELVEDLEVSSLEGVNTVHIPVAYTQEKIPASKENIITTEDLKEYPYLREVELPKVDAEIGLLIGNNVPKAMEPWQVINSEGEGPYAVRTILGWSVNGPLRGASEDNRTASVNKISLSADQSLEVQLEQYFNQDFSEVDEDKKELSVQDKRFMDIVSKGTKMVNQHYEVPLPFKRPNPTMPNNRPLALQRTKYLKKKLSKDEKYRNDYVGFMQDIIDKGYAERVPPERVQNQEDTKDGAVWYIPHHGVYHPQKKKIRVVFDCAAEYAGTSLNKELLQGPDLNNTLVGVLTRFRQEPVGLMADIESMFSQVRVPEEYRDYQRFLWWPEGNLDKPLQEYRMAVHVFGATSSPSCASFALKKLAEDGEGRYTEEVLESIRNNFYVDDLLKSTSTVKEGGHLAKDMREACKDGGFRLTKWVSNYKEVMDVVPSTERIAEVNLDLDCSHEAMATERALGMLWNIQSDTLGFRAVRREKPATRRGILSVVSSFYDPLGLVAPALLPPKKILQDLCRDKVGWDEDISEKHLRAWRQWEEELPLLSEHFQVSRCLKPNGFGKPITTQLHHFADASEVGYGTVSYVRMTSEQGDVHCAFVMGKSRVAPLKTMTIPRMELNAAVVAVRVNDLLMKELELDIQNVYFWTDSVTVLRYIRNQATRFRTFVANRLAVIHNKTEPQQWRYVNTTENPADEASRGQEVKAFLQNQRWLTGPQFLWAPRSEWPQMPEGLQQPLQRDPEVKVNAIGAEEAPQKSPMDALIAHYSSWHRLKKAVAWIIKVRQALKQKCKGGTTTTERGLTTSNLEQAEMVIMKHVQNRYYKQEVEALKGQGYVQAGSTILQLSPKLDVDGMLRVGGRLSQATLSEEAKNPMLLPKSSRVAELVVQEIHENHGHMGRNYVTAKVRERYWIPQSSTLIRKIISRCVICRRHHGKTGEQKMADLPSHRVTPDEPPFTNVGVDYFGPFEVKRGRSIVKRYGVIFTCTTTRAVHLEKADSLDTDSCINALRRFTARRGQVKAMWSDNGTNLVGAKTELRKELEKWNKEKIKESLLQKQVDWHFSPPTGSHFGGVWERQIRTIRQVLNAIAKEQQLDDEGLHTLFCEVEQIINTRPLTTISNDVNDLEALTPNHLLNMKMQTSLPPNLTDKDDLYARRRWKQVQYLADLFWKRWVKEYLPTLQGRQKWRTQRRNVAVGDLVLLKDENTPRGRWPLGRVIEVTYSSDGLVRRAKVKTQQSLLERPVVKICVLLEEDQTQE